MIKSIKEELAPVLSTNIIQCLVAGIFPNKLKIAKVSPLFKKGDPLIPGNYIPISLLPSLSKIFGKVIYNQLNDYFIHNKLFYNS